MSNTSAIVYTNLADAGTMTASSWIADAPPSRLQNAHTTRRWEGKNGESEYVLVQLTSAQSIDTIALLKCAGYFNSTLRDLSSAATTRVRVSSVDTTGIAGDLYDSGSLTGQIDFGALVVLLPTPVTALVVRIDLTEANADSLLAGRMIVGLRNAFTYNFGYGWSFGFNDLSRLKKSAGGQTFIDLDDRYRVLDVAFQIATSSERYGVIQSIDRLNGISMDILFITNVNSANLPRDTIWGLLQDTSPPTQPHPDFFAKSYSIQERL